MFPMCSRATSCLALLICSAHAQAALATWPPQFDLICDVRGHVIADPHPRSRGTYPANERNWHDRFRLIVDLRTRRYCYAGRCLDSGIRRIAAVNERRLLLGYVPRPGPIDNALSQAVRYRDGYYRFWSESDDGYTRLETGTCRRTRFSGIPADARPAQAR
jgi:hypothetical protein